VLEELLSLLFATLTLFVDADEAGVGAVAVKYVWCRVRAKWMYYVRERDGR